MDNYIVSARKYRPATFQSVIGQKSLTTTLKNAIQNRKLAHAYLFCGPRGVGKTTCARIFAKTINCLSPTSEGDACNACESCRSFNENRSYNIHELDAASNNSVDDIRSLIEQVRILPQIGKYKVYIIDEVHMLSSSAFNAFLKTLEEPPHHAIFVLATTEKHKVLPTILSRCQIYDFNRIGINDTVEYLQYVAQQEGVTTAPEALQVIAQKADGGMRDALSIFDQVVSFTGGNITYQAVIENLNVLDYEYYFKLVKAMLRDKVGECMLILNEILNKGFEGQHIVGGLASFFRDLLVCKDPATLVLFEVGDSVKERYSACAKACEIRFLYKAIELANRCDLDYRISRNKRLLIELLFIQLCQLNSAESPDEDKKKTELRSIATNTGAAKPDSPGEKPIAANHPKQTDFQTAPVNVSAPKAPAPSPQRPGLLSVSLKNPKGLSEKELPDTKHSSPAEQPVSDFSNEDLNRLWIAYADEFLQASPLVMNTMKTSLPVLKDNYRFEVKVHNHDQMQLLLEKSTDILTFLRDRLKNSEIRMDVSVTETGHTKIVLDDTKKLELMIAENKNLIGLIEEFDLRLD